MKTKLVLQFLFILFLAIKSLAQQNARPQAVNMTLQIGGSTPSNVGGGTAFPALIPVLAYSEGASSACTTQATCPAANQQDLSITIYQTNDYILLRQALVNHTPLNIELTSTFTAGDVSKVFLETAFVTSLSTGGSGGEDKLTLNVTFFAGKWDHYFDAAGAAPFTHFGWNFGTNSAYSHY